MPKQYLEIGSTPGSEPCAQVGQPNYETMARLECQTFINQLRRLFGAEPQGTLLRIKRNAHDFGHYLEVVCEYEDRSEASIDYAFKCEGEGPELWDAEAKAELKAARYNVKDLAEDTGVSNPLLGDGSPYYGIG